MIILKIQRTLMFKTKNSYKTFSKKLILEPLNEQNLHFLISVWETSDYVLVSPSWTLKLAGKNVCCICS